MTSTELRSRVHALIDSVRSDELLTHIHDLLSGTGGTKDTGIWATMTDAQRERVMKAYAASFDPANLSTTDEVMKRARHAGGTAVLPCSGRGHHRSGVHRHTDRTFSGHQEMKHKAPLKEPLEVDLTFARRAMTAAERNASFDRQVEVSPAAIAALLERVKKKRSDLTGRVRAS